VRKIAHAGIWAGGVGPPAFLPRLAVSTRAEACGIAVCLIPMGVWRDWVAAG